MDLGKLDALIADHVLSCDIGRKSIPIYPGISAWVRDGDNDVKQAPTEERVVYFCKCSPIRKHNGEDGMLANYSTDIARAWEVLTCGKWTWSIEEMADEGSRKIRCYLENEDDGIWADGYGPNAPLAICLAALKAKKHRRQ